MHQARPVHLLGLLPIGNMWRARGKPDNCAWRSRESPLHVVQYPSPPMGADRGFIPPLGSQLLRGPAYAAVVVRCAASQPQSRPMRPTAKDSVLSEPATSSEAAKKAHVSRHVQTAEGSPASTTDADAQAAATVFASQRRNKTLVFITGVIDARCFLAWLWSRCSNGLAAQTKGKTLMTRKRQMIFGPPSAL